MLKRITYLNLQLIYSLAHTLFKYPESESWVNSRLEVLKSRFREDKKTQIVFKHWDPKMYDKGWIVIESLATLEEVIEKPMWEEVSRQRDYIRNKT